MQVAAHLSNSTSTGHDGDYNLCWVWLGSWSALGLKVHLLWLLWQYHGLCCIKEQTLALSEAPNAPVSGVASSEAGPASPSFSGDGWLMATS